MKSLFLFFGLLIMSSCFYSPLPRPVPFVPFPRPLQNLNQPNISQDRPPNEPGKCYQKSVVSPMPQFVFRYTGTESEPAFVETKEIVIQEASTEWVKKKADKNCRSRNPNDCLVWCLVEVPFASEMIPIVTDTSQQKAFEWVNLSQVFLNDKDPELIWTEVVCANDVTNKMLIQIKQNLNAKGYLIDSLDDPILDEQTLSILVQYQKDHGLPSGSINTETMIHLGVKY